MLVEEVPKSINTNAKTVYFSSSVNLSARSSGNRYADESGADSAQKGRAKVNYNLNQLFNAQTQSNSASKDNGSLKSAQQIQLERSVQKRVSELNQESSGKGFELPKNFQYTGIRASRDPRHASQKSRLGTTPATKRILAARRNLNSYYEEERNLISVNTILSLNYQFLDYSETEGKPRKMERPRPKIRLCCICGSQSSYSRCPSCGLYFCCVKCNKLHLESRCA
ncbi:uncharacterized protein LODBEIA_P50130 [Lodderomyces beijingensis]|uniref:HIT-type domain-containing protein n=1 Tax=Lodderomyces beijingensis TaxID=1775926 RepID=A0ABP0ZS98_9ASCO